MRKRSARPGFRYLLLLAAASTAAIALPVLAADPATSITLSTADARWSVDAASQLVGVIESARDEGLNPLDYGLAALRRAVTAGKGAALDALADAAALQLAHDYYFGRVGDRSTMGWMIERSPYQGQQLAARLQDAVAKADLPRFYAALLPSDARYAALRDALAGTADPAEHDRLRVNMERWRWMPRTVADNYLYVNVPSYRLQVVSGGVTRSTYDVVVGAPDTPTPQMVSPTGSLVVNPAWNVPASIVRKSGLRPGRGGFIWRASADGGYRVMQPPGPRNALGRIKFNLANDQAIYLHDTNAKAAFNRGERALSHGCIRVKNIDQLASELMSEGGDEAALEDALAQRQTATLRLPQTWPVYLVYFTADTDESGAVVNYRDPYGYDAKVLTALNGSPVQMASN